MATHGCVKGFCGAHLTKAQTLAGSFAGIRWAYSSQSRADLAAATGGFLRRIQSQVRRGDQVGSVGNLQPFCRSEQPTLDEYS